MNTLNFKVMFKTICCICFCMLFFSFTTDKPLLLKNIPVNYLNHNPIQTTGVLNLTGTNNGYMGESTIVIPIYKGFKRIVVSQNVQHLRISNQGNVVITLIYSTPYSQMEIAPTHPWEQYILSEGYKVIKEYNVDFNFPNECEEGSLTFRVHFDGIPDFYTASFTVTAF